MLKKLLLSLVIITAIGAGYFAYDKWSKNTIQSLWDFVPEDASLVFETNQLDEILSHLKEQQTWKTLSLIREFSEIKNKQKYLDSLSGKEEVILNFTKGIPLLISTHVTGLNTFDFLLLAEVKSINQHDLLAQIQKLFIDIGYVKKTRKYYGYVITELQNKEGVRFTYIFFKNYFIGSTTSYLVEDAIRTQAEEKLISFQNKFPELMPLAKLKQDQGNLYINQANFSRLVNVFSTPLNLENFSKSAYLDLIIDDESIVLNGFSFAERDDFLNRMSAINGAPFDMSEIISNETAKLYHFSFSDKNNWNQQLVTAIASEKIKTLKANFIKDLDFDVDHVYTLIDEEVAISEMLLNGTIQKTLYLETVDTQLAIDFFDGIINRYALAQNDSIYIEYFGDFKIRNFPAVNYPEALVGEMASGFEDCYYTSHRNYLIFSSSLQALKNTLEDIIDEDTWHKSLRKSKFLSQTNQEASFSVFINTPAMWDILTNNINPFWLKFFNENAYVFGSFENIALQFNAVDNKFFTSILINQPDARFFGESTTEKVSSLMFDAPIISKPTLVKNHNTNFYDILIQDSIKNLYLMDKELNVLWNIPFEQEIVHKIYQLDYYKNGKLQYAFITSDKLHILDRNGSYLPGYPRELNNAKPFMFLNVLDYDGSRDYRLCITDIAGNVFITDKDGKPLGGWNPKSFGSPLTSTPRHYRIGGTDIYSVTLKNGEMHLLSRRGKNYPGFPIKLDDEIIAESNMVVGSKFASSQWTIVTKSGQIFSTDLKGKTLKREQLYKQESSTKFTLLNDVLGKSYIIVSSAENQISLLDQNGNPLFTKDYFPEQDVFVQYYRLGNTKNYIILGDKMGKFIYCYDMTGKLITSRPIIGNQPVSMLYFEKQDEHSLYVVDESELMLLKLN